MFTIGESLLRTQYDPSQVDTTLSYYMIHNLGGTLLLLGDDDKYYSYLARKWEVDSEKKEITFYLQNNLKFSDGSPITSREVEYSFKRLMVKGSTHISPRRYIIGSEACNKISSVVPGIVVIDPQTIKFRLQTISPTILFIFTQPDSTILSPSQVNSESLDVENWRITSGAYCVKEQNAAVHLFSANRYGVFYCQEMPQEVKFVKISSNLDHVRALAEGKIQFTFFSSFASEEEYKILRDSQAVDIIPHAMGGTFIITLNKKIEQFRDKKYRQFLYRYFRNKLGDIRPLKDDRYFINTGQLIMPTHIGSVEEPTEAFLPQDIPAVKPQEFEQLEYLWFISGNNFKSIIRLFENLGLHITAYDMNLLDKPRIVDLLDQSPFFVSPMHIDEKEVGDSIEYLLHSGECMAENKDQIRELNAKLINSNDTKEKSLLMKEINRLIIDDAVIIPFYHIIHQTIINKDYQVIRENEFSAAPKIWNIRRQPQPAKSSA